MGNTALRVNASAVDNINVDFARGSITRANGVTYEAAYCTDGKVHIFEISADHLTVTDRISFTTLGEVPQRICLGLFQSDNSLAFAYQSTLENNNNAIRYAKINTTTWAAPTLENVAGLAGASNWYSNFDMDVTDTGMPVIAFLWVSNGSCQLNVYSRALTGGAWTQTFQTNIYTTGTRRRAGECVSIAALGISGGVRDAVVVYGATSSTSDFGNQLRTFKITESTGAQSGAGTDRVTYMVDSIDKTDTTAGRRRHCKVYRVSGGNWFVGNMNLVTRKVSYDFGSWVGSSSTFTRSTETTKQIIDFVWTGMSMSFGQSLGGVGLTFWIRDDKGIPWGKSVYPVAGGGYGIQDTTGRAHPGDATFSVISISDNASPFPATTIQHIVLQQVNSTTGATTIYDHWTGFPTTMPGGNSGIISLTPADGTANVSGNPGLGVEADIGIAYSESPDFVEFQFAADSTFTTSVQTYLQPTAFGQFINGTDTPGVTVTLSDILTTITLSKAVWFYRARLVDFWGNRSAWTATQSFTVGHPPAAIPTSPQQGGYYYWNGGIRTFTWQFTDPSLNDFQTAYQVQILDSAGTVVQDSGKVLSSSNSYTSTALAAGLKDTLVSWQVRLWDSTDTPGVYSVPQQFTLTDPLVVTITYPGSGAVAITGTPTYTFNATTGAGRRIKGYSIILTQADKIVYAGPTVPIDVASGASVNAKQPPNYLQNSQSYTVQISAIDSGGLVGVSNPVQFSVAWTPPATPTGIAVSVASYDLEGAGYNLVTWADTGRATGFTHWTVYRKDDLIDSAGNVVQAGTFQPIYQDYDTGTTYAYQDYLAPANYKVTYAVTQWINSSGQDMESLMGTATAVIASSSAYWLISPKDDGVSADTYKFSIVTSDSFTEEQEEAEFTVLGRGRIVNRGQYLGPKGSLDVQLRNTGLLTARQKRLALLALQQQGNSAFLRNPFGDVWEVNMSNMSVSRLAGVGVSEFCDVSIPYAKVS